MESHLIRFLKGSGSMLDFPRVWKSRELFLFAELLSVNRI
jgi:hypothetical protein